MHILQITHKTLHNKGYLLWGAPGDVEALVTGVATEAGAGPWLVVEAIWASTSITNKTTSSEGSDRVRSKTGKSSSKYKNIYNHKNVQATS